ncbi:MAG: RICIN domain-containing protein [Clostridia bacterium]|nr:RICIN domain-containing protein [Clostridia bacterium]
MKRKFNLIVAVLLVVAMFSALLPIKSEALSYSGSSSYASGKYYRALTNVQLTGNQRTDIVNIAKSQIGYQEGGSSGRYSGEVPGSNNYTEYGRWYGSYIGESWYSGAQWCAMFVSWCAYNAGVSESIIDYHQYTESQVKLFKNQGRAYSWATVKAGGYTPLPGDVVYFLSSSGAASGRTVNHVGLVTGYSNGTLYTIEGNTSSAYFSTDGGCCSDKSYPSSSTYVRYICRPNYTTGDSLEESGLIPSSLKSVVFDANYYASKNADLKAAFGTDAQKLYNHFLDFGIKEGRQASPNFSIKYYTESNSDLKAAFGTNYLKAMEHFVKYGSKEIRKTAAPTDIGNNIDLRINVNGLSLGLSGSNVVTASKAVDATQAWTFIKNADDGTYTIKNKKTGNVLDVAGAANKAGTNVQTYAGNGSNAQRWYLYERETGVYVIQPKCSTTCVLDVSNGSTSAGANIQIYTSNGTAAQKYSFASISKIENFAASNTCVNLGTEFYAQISGVGSGKNLADSSSTVALANNAVVANQLWKFVRHSDGSYKIVNQASGKVLDVYGGYDASGTKVQTYASNDSNAQRWLIYNTSNGYVFLPKNSTSCVLDVVGAGTTAGTKLQIYTYNESAAQKFKVTKVSGDYMDIVGSTTIGTGFYANIAIGSQSLGVSGTNVQLVKTSTSSSSQTWKFDLQSDGTYKITHKATGKVLDVSGASDADFANVQIYDSNNTRAQRWYVYQKEGKFIIRSAVSKTRVLDVYAGNIATGSNISIYTRNYSNAQMFSINKV